MWNLKSKINEQRKEKETHKQRDQTDGCQRRKVEGLGEKGEEIEKYKLVVTNQSQGHKYGIRNIVNNIVITMYGARQVLEISRESLSKVYDCLTTMLYT